jgi:hypothetical protein
MKKVMFGLAAVLVALAFFACGSEPTVNAPKIEGEVTQEKVHAALEQIYSDYQGKLIMDGATTYTVVRGDTLIGIAQKNWSGAGVPDAGNKKGYYFPVLILASPLAGIVDPDQIEPGMQFTVVDLEKNIADATAKSAIKSCIADVGYVYRKKAEIADLSDAQKEEITNFSVKLYEVSNKL